MEITLENKYIKIVDGNKVVKLREDNLVNITLLNDYIHLETNQMGVSQDIRIYPDYVTIPAHSSIGDLFATLESYFNMIKSESLLPREIDGHVTRTLSVTDVMNTIIHNVGQTDVNINLTLPVPQAGYKFRLQCGEPSGHYFRITAPTGKMIIDGVTGQTYAQFSTPSIGKYMNVFTEKVLPAIDGFITAPTLSIGTTDKFEVKNAAFTCAIGGVVVSTGSYETPTGTDVIPSGKWGATAIDINASGEYSVVSAANNATGYTTSALAIAGLPELEAGKLRLGTIAVKKTGGGFTFGTTEFDTANVTVIFTSSTVLIPEYNWVANTTYPKLISGTTIKTINGVSLLGSGDIELQTPAIKNSVTNGIVENGIMDVSPANHKIYSLYIENYGTETAIINIGTTEGGVDVVSALEVPVGFMFVEKPTLLKDWFTAGQENTLYISSSSWTDVTIAASLTYIKLW